MPRKSSSAVRVRGWRVGVLPVLGALLALAVGGAACSDDEETNPPACIGGGGPVLSEAPDNHCMGRVQDIGACVSAADEDDLASGDEEEELGVFFGREADDDDCKYRVSFTNTCIALNQPVTFNLSLRRKQDNGVASGALPSNPEIYLADDPGHISPSNEITAPESPAGSYAIGPIVFDRSGRWVVRFHFFETCSDLPEDAPHGHAAFYIDVP
jgi:hypothetical protein